MAERSLADISAGPTWGRKHAQVCKPLPWEGQEAEEKGSASEPHHATPGTHEAGQGQAEPQTCCILEGGSPGEL